MVPALGLAVRLIGERPARSIVAFTPGVLRAIFTMPMMATPVAIVVRAVRGTTPKQQRLRSKNHG